MNFEIHSVFIPSDHVDTCRIDQNWRVNFHVHNHILHFYFCTDAQKDFIDGTYIKTHNKLLLTNGRALGMRSDYNGILLFDTILQPTVEKSYDIVEIELPVFEVN